MHFFRSPLGSALILLVSLSSAGAALAADKKPAAKGTATPTTANLSNVTIPTPNPNHKPPEKNAAGFPAPSFEGFEKLGPPRSGTIDASLEIPGPDTMVEVWHAKNGDELYKFITHGVFFAVGVTPAGDATKGYVLFDEKCEKKWTVKLAADAPWVVPRCALDAKPK
jgi:hypothetical protein